jgi:acyl-CoA synthetase (AMP-forming)/AMP-acid ligase II/thioredoxin reductase/acyl carrier protein
MTHRRTRSPKILALEPNDLSSPVEALRQRALDRPGETALTFLTGDDLSEVHWTYGDLDLRARAIATQLTERGATGKRALLMFDPGLDFVAALAGCLYAGVVAVPLYPPDPMRVQRTLPRLQTILADVEGQLVLTTGHLVGWLQQTLLHQTSNPAPLQFLATDQIEFEDYRRSTPQIPDRDQLAIIQYTSGSTSTPKGVMVTHANLLANLDQIAANVDFDGVVVANWLPTYHDMGLIGATIAPWYRGRRNIMLSPLSFFQRPLRWLQAISRFRVTSSAAPNFAYDLCVQKTTPNERTGLDLSSWCVALNGAEPIRAATMDLFTEAFAPYGFRREAFYPSYGLAEATLMVSGGPRLRTPVVKTRTEGPQAPGNLSVATHREGSARIVGCGRSVAEGQVIVVEPETRSRLPQSQVGEIWVSGPQVAAGYWRCPDETQHTFAAHTADGEGPFLRTGDYGFLENDELFIVGRLKELIIVQGRNHYPHDIELTVERSDPALKAYGGAVFSIETGDDEQVVVVHEVLRPGRVDLHALITTIRSEVSRDHQLDVNAIVLIKSGTIPKTSSGKTQRTVCREQFLTGKLRTVAQWQAAAEQNTIRDRPPYVAPQTETEKLLCKVWADVLGIGRVGVDDDFFDLGGQSLMATQMVTRLAPHFEIDIPLRSLFDCSTVATLAERLDSTQRQPLDPASIDALIDQMEALTDNDARKLLDTMNTPKPSKSETTPSKLQPQLDYLIIGCGPAGLQLGYFLQRAGLRYQILEAGESPGTFFKEFPRHRKLISINKVYTGYDDPEVNLRWDWNSLLTDDLEFLFKDYSRQYMPHADHLVKYLCDFAAKFDLHVKYDTRVEKISKNDTFCIEDQHQNKYTARVVIIATGCSKPFIPEITGIELTENYNDMSIDPDHFKGQRVLILGKGNSAFETADNLIGTTSLLHLVSPDTVKFAWKTHFVGHLRAINNNLLDTYQLKSQNALLDANVRRIRKEGDRFAVSFGYAHASGEHEEIFYDRVICCTGFRFDDAFFDESCKPELAIHDRFPKLTSGWESTNVPDLYFAGTLMQQRDFKKTQSAFIHGFRYNVEMLSRLLNEKYHQRPLASVRIPASPAALANRILERINRNSSLWQQTGYMCDVIVIPSDGSPAEYFEDLTCDYAHDRWTDASDHYYLVTMEFGQERIDAVGDIFAIERPHKDDINRAADSTGIHPIIRRYAAGKLISTHHVIEDLFSQWNQPNHYDPLVAHLTGELSAGSAPRGLAIPSDATAKEPWIHENTS